MISFAAAFIILGKIAVFKDHGKELPGASDSLLTTVIARLNKAAYAPDHAPAKCAQLIAAWVDTWQRWRGSTKSNLDADNDDCGTTGIEHAVSAERTSPHSAPSAGPGLGGYGIPGAEKQPASEEMLPSIGSAHDFNRFMSSDIFLDTEFWVSFMQNIANSPNTPNITW